MLSARMLILSACLAKKSLKIEKVLSLMRVYQQMPGAMTVDLMAKVEAAYLKPVLATQEVCHA
jgi:hypothetical protein